MPRNGSGVYSKPAGTTAVADTTIESAKYNSTIDDLVQDANAARPITAGGTGAQSVGAARQAFTTFTTKTSGYTAAAADAGAVHRCTATMTVALTAASSLGANWSLTIIADGGDITIDPNSTETIDGKTTLTVRNVSAVTIYCDGSNFRTNLASDQRVPRGHINGLTLSNNSTDATNDIDIATGETASDGTTPYLMVLTTAITKRLDATWAVGTGNGGLDTGTIADGTYYVFLIQRSDTGVVDVLFSVNLNAPTLPSGYDRKRRIGGFVRASGTIRPFVQFGDVFLYKTPFGSVDVTNPGTSAVSINISIPGGAAAAAIFNAAISNSSTTNFRTGVLFSSPDQTDQAPSETAAPLLSLSSAFSGANGSFSVAGRFEIPVDASGQIRYRVLLSDASVRLIVTTLGWVDRRGR